MVGLGMGAMVNATTGEIINFGTNRARIMLYFVAQKQKLHCRTSFLVGLRVGGQKNLHIGIKGQETAAYELQFFHLKIWKLLLG